MHTWAAFRWNSKAVNVVMAYRDYGRFPTRDMARQALLSEIQNEITGWRRSPSRLKHNLLPKLMRIRAALQRDTTINRVVVEGLKFVLVSPEQLACDHAQHGPVLCDCLSTSWPTAQPCSSVPRKRLIRRGRHQQTDDPPRPRPAPPGSTQPHRCGCAPLQPTQPQEDR